MDPFRDDDARDADEPRGAVHRRAFEVMATSAAVPERVFTVLADATCWSEWAGPLVTVSYWETEGVPPPGGVGAVRHVGTKRMAGIEEIVAYDPPHHHAYVVRRGLPCRYYRGDVHLAADGSGTRIVWKAVYEPRNRIAGLVLGVVLPRILRTFARRLGDFAARP